MAPYIEYWNPQAYKIAQNGFVLLAEQNYSCCHGCGLVLNAKMTV